MSSRLVPYFDSRQQCDASSRISDTAGRVQRDVPPNESRIPVAKAREDGSHVPLPSPPTKRAVPRKFPRLFDIRLDFRRSTDLRSTSRARLCIISSRSRAFRSTQVGVTIQARHSNRYGRHRREVGRAFFSPPFRIVRCVTSGRGCAVCGCLRERAFRLRGES